MPIQSIEEWATPRAESFPITSLRDAVIGVDASHYLDLRLNTPSSIEPLLNAIGGDPYTLKASLRDDLKSFQSVDATLVFVFEGLDYGNKDVYTSPKAHATQRAHKDGWKEYYNKENGKEVAAERTLKAFAKASYPVGKVMRYFQSLLKQHSVSFIVAPYSAAAQLAYLERGDPRTKQENTQFIDAIIGSTELFLFEVEKVITNFSTRQGSETFDVLSRSACMERLDKVSDDVFRDVQLLLGGRFLPAFPPLDRPGGSRIGPRDALNMLNTAGRSVIQLCNQCRDEQVQALDYEDRYKRAVLSLRHHVVLDKEGRAILTGPEYEADDAHEFLGLRLPEELYFYISRGMIGTRVPSWLTSGEIDLTLPVGCEDSEAYRRLVGTQLTRLLTQTVCLLSNSMNRFYQSRNIKIKMWDSKDKSINVKDEPSVRDKIIGWKISETTLLQNTQGSSGKSPGGWVSFTEALKNPKCRQIANAKDETPPLRSKAEIVFNVLGRFLQLRGFVDEKHELTTWGKAFQKALLSLDAPNNNFGDGVYLAFEMLRLGLFDSRNIVSGSGRSKAEDKNPAKLMVTKTACFGRLKHASIGYSGPLDREMLAVEFMIDAVRTSLRDLLETILVSMCLNGVIDRNRTDWSDIVFSLPLLNDRGAGLAIAVSTYFDDVSRQSKKKNEATPSEETKEEVRSNFGYLPRVPNITKNLRNAFDLWDAVYAGSKEVLGGEEMGGMRSSTGKALDEANTWLSAMR